MKTIPLYKYERENGGTTVSPNKPNTEYTEMYRLVADKGMVLTDGTTTTYCVDTDDASVWSEIVDNENNENVQANPELTEKAKAYDIIVGVSE